MSLVKADGVQYPLREPHGHRVTEFMESRSRPKSWARVPLASHRNLVLGLSSVTPAKGELGHGTKRTVVVQAKGDPDTAAQLALQRLGAAKPGAPRASRAVVRWGFPSITMKIKRPSVCSTKVREHTKIVTSLHHHTRTGSICTMRAAPQQTPSLACSLSFVLQAHLDRTPMPYALGLLLRFGECNDMCSFGKV